MWEGRPRHPLTLVSELRQAQVPNARRSPPPWRHPGSAALPWRAHPGRGRRRWCSAARPLSAPCKQWRESHSVWKGVAAVNRALLHTQFLRRAKNKGSVPQRLLLGGGGWLPWVVLCCAPTFCAMQTIKRVSRSVCSWVEGGGCRGSCSAARPLSAPGRR